MKYYWHFPKYFVKSFLIIRYYELRQMRVKLKVNTSSQWEVVLFDTSHPISRSDDINHTLCHWLWVSPIRRRLFDLLVPGSFPDKFYRVGREEIYCILVLPNWKSLPGFHHYISGCLSRRRWGCQNLYRIWKAWICH